MEISNITMELASNNEFANGPISLSDDNNLDNFCDNGCQEIAIRAIRCLFNKGVVKRIDWESNTERWTMKYVNDKITLLKTNRHNP